MAGITGLYKHCLVHARLSMTILAIFWGILDVFTGVAIRALDLPVFSIQCITSLAMFKIDHTVLPIVASKAVCTKITYVCLGKVFLVT